MGMKEIKNVVLLVCDSLSAKRMSIYGHKRNTTPNIESFLKRGEIYDNVRSNASWTFLSFPSFLRSKLPSSIKVSDLLSKDEVFTTKLAQSGVESHAFLIKAKQNEVAILQNIKFAFDKDKVSEFTIYQNKERLLSAADLINQPSDNKRFVLIHDATAHMTYDPPEELRGFFGDQPTTESIDRARAVKMMKQPYDPSFSYLAKRLYDQGVRHLDQLFADFISTIGSSTLSETVVILTADHGESLGDHMNHYNHGYNLYDDLLRIPFCVYDPSRSSGYSDKPFSALDFAPTIFDRFGLASPYNDHIPISLEAEVDDERVLIAEGARSPEVGPREDLKYLVEAYGDNRLIAPVTQKSVVKGHFKYHIYAQGFSVQEFIYDLKEDPDEKVNLLSNALISEEVAKFYYDTRDSLRI